NTTSREEWATLFKMEYDSTRLKRTMIFSRQFENGETPSMVIAEQYEHSKKIMTSVYDFASDREGKNVIYITYKYNGNSQLIEETTSHLAGVTPVPPKHYRYQDTLLVEEWYAADDSTISEHYTYKHNDKGKLIEKKLQIEPDILAKQLYTFKY